ncbi:hypothetical protein GF412_03780 [Candidatus Micrarchaeota archaeon]|nr:hypothetical protein [Candidatus Micrarchaeota archaeon]MBD3418070.1 hypothetical protein [Candidatus Micrarchaeota archaeon]
MTNTLKQRRGEGALRERISGMRKKIIGAIARYKKIEIGKEQFIWLMALRSMEEANPSLKGHSENLALRWAGNNCFEVDLLNQKTGTGRKIITSPDMLGYVPVVTSPVNMSTSENYETIFCKNSLFLESQQSLGLLMRGDKYFESLENAISADPAFAKTLEGPKAGGILKSAVYGGAIAGTVAGISSAIFGIHSAFVAGFAGIAAFIFGARNYAKQMKLIKSIEFACVLGEEVSCAAKKIADAIEHSSGELVKLNRELEKRETRTVREELNSQEP